MLKGKTALITGSTSGIGLGIAKALAAQGAKVVLNGFGDAAGPQAEVAACFRVSAAALRGRFSELRAHLDLKPFDPRYRGASGSNGT